MQNIDFINRFERMLRMTESIYANTKADERWLFVLGVNNSGTTLLANFLSSHPEIEGLPNEGQYLTDAIPHPKTEGVPRMWSKKLDVFRWLENDSAEAAAKARSDWSKHYRENDVYWLEKSPPNTIRSRWLQAHFPNPHFISIVRHPIAVCEGMKRRIGCSIEEAAHHWLDSNSLLINDMQYLNKVILIRYEDLVTDSIGTTNKISKLLQLNEKFDPNLFKSVRSHSIEGETQGFANLNLKSFENLSIIETDKVLNICKPLMDFFEYDRHI